MKFTRTKKIIFTNNKGGVGKTTLTFNLAKKFADNGYKVGMVDLDPQCNLTNLSGIDKNAKNIYDVLQGIVEGGKDIDSQINLDKVSDNLFILPGSVNLSLYENLLSTAYGQAASGTRIGYFITSAIDRYLREKGLSEEFDIFMIDTSPSLALLNQIIFLGSDYFVVPLMPDAFSLQGIENIGLVYERWKNNWKNTGKALSGETENKFILSGEGLFVGYIINSYNVYAKQPIKDHRHWIEEIPGKVKFFLSEKHCRNGLVEKSWKNPLSIIQDYGRIPAKCQEYNSAIFDIDPNLISEQHLGTKENIDKAKEEFENLFLNLEQVLKDY